MENTYRTVYAGSEPNIQYLQEILDKAGIRSMVKNDFESGLRGGFGGGLPGMVELQVEASHYEEAKQIADSTFPPQEQPDKGK